MPPNKKITFTEVSQKRFWQLQNILDSGLLGPVIPSGTMGALAYILTDSGVTALRVIAGVYFVSVTLNKMIKNARKKKE